MGFFGVLVLLPVVNRGKKTTKNQCNIYVCVLQAAQEPNAQFAYIGFYNRCLWNVGACAAL